jgi:hypothetical protein
MERTTLETGRRGAGTGETEHPSAADTRVKRITSGGYATTITDRWNAIPLVASASFVRRGRRRHAP